MKLLVYVSVMNEDWVRLGAAIDDSAPRECVELFRRIDGLRERLSQPIQRPAVLVLVAATEAELKALVDLAPLLYDLKTILILPDHEAMAAREGHRLAPRYCTYIDSNFDELRSVIRHIFGLSHHDVAEDTASEAPVAQGRREAHKPRIEGSARENVA
ncbi:hypothetical protein Deba_0484 [Desulfarculus baarsii DSM 2075]|uniref:Response regulator receiver protein n=1 Tax=Desulfarculus baarsii (strain ATCC 33931 / DSM 2075 / LMG 7858 / VKM B-1802 / 2st14) TaxID=644282 RepID=E1QE71_DESB2|nr:hypothetical protein [Desulfarculus baarsii]ADK83857.1 hypothetical protein Deba_0484 [Desulfarculus baarsii DSM 2075]